MPLESPLIPAVIVCFVSIVASIILFRSIYRLPTKPISLKMILILIISDFISYIVSICSFFEVGLLSIEIWMYLLITIYTFSIVWTLVIALFVVRSVSKSGVSNPEQYLKISFILTLLISFSLGSRYQEFNNSYWFPSLMLFIIAGTMALYLAARSILKGYPIEFQYSIRPAVKTLFLYTLVECVTFGQYLILLIWYFTKVPNLFVVGGVIAFMNTTGIFNMLIYVFGPRRHVDFNEKDVNQSHEHSMNVSLGGQYSTY